VGARQLAHAITGRTEQRELFEAAPAAEHAVAVRLDRVRVERGRAFEDVWLGWTLWRALRLDELCTTLLPRGREAIPWAQMAAVSVIARVCAPASELHIAEDWYRTTALKTGQGPGPVARPPRPEAPRAPEAATGGRDVAPLRDLSGRKHACRLVELAKLG